MAIACSPVGVLAADLPPAQLQFFETHVRPVLVQNCYKCHSRATERVKGGLMLDSRDGLLKGGNSGPAIIPGDPEHSLLIKAVRYADPDLQMPPKGAKLADNQVADLVSWVKMGAPDPRSGAEKGWNGDAKSHWSWVPVVKSPVPEVKDPSWCKTPIDNFILAKLESKDLKPNPPADKRTLIRRATFDLIGLPPTPEEVDDFLKDESPEAFAKVVDRLLASPHYGERWGRHWLDVARYSDTKGQVRRQQEDPNYIFAWTYRDYVIRSLNEDKPFNVFIIEQLAADKLPGTAQNPANLAALGFLTLGDRFMGMPNDIVNDRIDVVTKGFLGLTVTCARCHNHKFDPIPTADYYSLHGILSSCVEPSIEPVISKITAGPEYSDYYKQRMGLEAEKDSLEAKLREARRTRDRMAIQREQRLLRDNRTAVVKLETTHPAAPARAIVLEDSPKPHDSPIFVRGDAGNKGQIVPRRFPEILSGPVRPVFTNGSGRLQLAYAVASKTDPATPRVIVNRVWLHHFGEGFVSTPDDLGTMAEQPSHLELINYLAARFMDEGWSLKKMHRLIMLSSVYQESSADNPRFAQVDPANRLLWRANIRRLEFEPLRDSLLAIGGKLDPAMYGRPIHFDRQQDSGRRTIYGFVDRSEIADVLVNFDFATPDLPTGRRHETTVPQQALFMMNSPLVVELAKKLVTLAEFKNCSDDEARVQFLYNRIWQRPARPEEVKLGIEFVSETVETEKVAGLEDRPNGVQRVSNQENAPAQKQQQGQPGRRPGNGQPKQRAPLKPWEEYAHALLQANETSFVN